MIWLPLPNEIQKQELKSSYLSFLVRVFIIKWEEKFEVKITKQKFSEEMKKLNWNRKRICQTWNNWSEWKFIQKITPDYLILQGKEKVSENWFITRIEWDFDIWYYSYCKKLTEIYSLRPVNQTNEFNNTYKFKKSNLYNKEILKRSLWEKKWRWQRKLSKNVWCCLKTTNNRLKKSNKVKTLKRYDNYNWYRIQKTNLYFPLEDIVFYRYQNKNNTTTKRRISLSSDHSSLITQKAIFLNGSLSLNKSNDLIYNLANLEIIS